jgi:predicted enzyme related to lactoylglutathione lyase
MVASNGSFVWYELMTTDVEGAKAFYSNVLGWGARDASMSGLAYQLLTVEDAPVAGLTQLPEEARNAGVAAHWTGYICVDDIDATARRVEALGGMVHAPPTDVSNVSRFSIIADPQGTTIALIKRPEPGEETRPSALDAPGRGGWHELLASNWEKAFTFYAALFGWQKADAQQGMMGTYQQFSVAGETIGGMYTKPPTLPHPFWLYYFNVTDIQAAARHVEASGGEIIYGPVEAPGGNWILHCLDPQGAVFALLNRPARKVVGYSLPGIPDRSRKR